MGKQKPAQTHDTKRITLRTLALVGLGSRLHGLEARLGALECEQGFSDTHASDALTQKAAQEFLGEQFYLTSIQYKFHACCHGTQASIEACKALKNDSEFKTADIKAINIRLHRDG